MMFATAARPPTCNSLDAEQRTRWMKTTRKLGKVLGTTPFILEHSSLAPNNKSTTGLASCNASSLNLNLNLTRTSSVSDSCSSSDPILAARALASLTTPIPGSERTDSPRPPVLSIPTLSCIPPSPSALEFEDKENESLSELRDREKEREDILVARRRKMEKLVRHLGECVPTELVFPREGTQVSISRSSSTVRRISISHGTKPRVSLERDAGMGMALGKGHRKSLSKGRSARAEYRDVVSLLREFKSS